MMANLDFTEGATESTLSIPIDNDSTDESNGTIRVTLQPDNADIIFIHVIHQPAKF